MSKLAFISHASEDAAIADTISGYLENNGVSCWIAPRDVTPGREYSSEIVEGIESSAVFVLVLSENANESIFVKREVERAVSKGKPIFPIRVREVMPSKSLELFISSAHWIDAWKPPMEKYLERLAQSISSTAAVYPAAAPASAPMAATVAGSSPVRNRRRILVATAATIALLVLGGIGWYAYGLHSTDEGARAILDKWAETHESAGPLGSPTSDTVPTFDGIGRFRNFEGGIVSWHPETGAHIVWGLIGERWLQIGRERFGYPVTDELATPDGRGRFNHFRAVHLPAWSEASIYWSPETGAHEVYGAIRAKWAAMGWERSHLGYPISAEEDHAGGRIQRFQGGALFWTPQGGVVVQ